MSIKYKIKSIYKNIKKLFTGCFSKEEDYKQHIDYILEKTIEIIDNTKDTLDKIEDGITEIIGIVDDFDSSL